MKKKKDYPKPLTAIENLTYNFPDIWDKVNPLDFSTTQKFCNDNNIFESMYIVSALSKWRQSKQIFEVDEELCSIFMETNKIDEEIPNEIVERLIYDCFYVKLPDKYINVKSIKNSSGEYFNFEVDGFFYHTIDKSIIIVIMFSSGHTQSLGFDFHEGLTLKETIDKYMKVSTDVYSLINFFIQIVLYLCADNADVEENYIQKQIYKPSVKKVKDSYSELRKWDVGFRYGKAIKRLRQTERKSSSNNSSEHHEGSHSRKRTHVRRGHYHHFWRGTESNGNRELILKWISPVVINAEYENIATIRKVKK